MQSHSLEVENIYTPDRTGQVPIVRKYVFSVTSATTLSAGTYTFAHLPGHKAYELAGTVVTTAFPADTSISLNLNNVQIGFWGKDVPVATWYSSWPGTTVTGPAGRVLATGDIGTLSIAFKDAAATTGALSVFLREYDLNVPSGATLSSLTSP